MREERHDDGGGCPADKGYHSNERMVALAELGLRSYANSHSPAYYRKTRELCVNPTCSCGQFGESTRPLCESDHDGVLEQWRLADERARYEAKRAERRYRAVEPENPLVARGLETDWER